MESSFCTKTDSPIRALQSGEEVVERDVGTPIKAEFCHILNIMEQVNREQILDVFHSIRPKRYPMKLQREVVLFWFF